MKSTEERAEEYAKRKSGCQPWQYTSSAYRNYKQIYIDIATEMEQNPSDALIMRILNCIGYEDESWIDFVRKELEKRKEK